nr:immunoglobulin heavy chain junction region [Macaca mulatta]
YARDNGIRQYFEFW